MLKDVHSEKKLSMLKIHGSHKSRSMVRQNIWVSSRQKNKLLTPMMWRQENTSESFHVPMISMRDDFFPVAFYGLTDLNEPWMKKPHETPIETAGDIDAFLPQT